MIFEVTILGSSSATPIYQRHPTAQVLNINERLFLIDCGEGTLIQLNRYRIKFHRINHIFISHLHGDHYLGLVGLMSTMHLQGRTSELHVYCPEPLKEIVDIQLKYSETNLRYPIHYHFLNHAEPGIIYSDEGMEVKTIKLNHRIPCSGFIFSEKMAQRKLKKDQLNKFNIPVASYFDLKNGKDYISPEGKVIPNAELTLEPKAPRSYAFCSDTLYEENTILAVKNVNLLYHEATFLSDKTARAFETFHSTAAQAATVAKKANAKRLIIGHFSARYKNLYPLLEEARAVFPETLLAIEGDSFKVE